MSETISLADLKQLVRQLKAIDAKDVTLSVHGSTLAASAQGIYVTQIKIPCDQHYTFSPKCAEKKVWIDIHGLERQGCRTHSHVETAEMTTEIDIVGAPAPIKRTLSTKAIVSLIKASTKLKAKRLTLTSLVGFRQHD